MMVKQQRHAQKVGSFTLTSNLTIAPVYSPQQNFTQALEYARLLLHHFHLRDGSSEIGKFRQIGANILNLIHAIRFIRVIRISSYSNYYFY